MSFFKRAIIITVVSSILVAGSYSMFLHRFKEKTYIRVSTGAALLKHNGKFKDKEQFGSSKYSRLFPFLYDEKGANDRFWVEKSKLFIGPKVPKLAKDSFFSEVKGKKEELPDKLRLACKQAYESPVPEDKVWKSEVKWKEVNRYCTWWQGKLDV